MSNLFADWLGAPESSMFVLAMELRKGGLIASTGRGTAGADMKAEDAAMLLLGFLATRSDFQPTKVEHGVLTFGTADLPQCLGVDPQAGLRPVPVDGPETWPEALRAAEDRTKLARALVTAIAHPGIYCVRMDIEPNMRVFDLVFREGASFKGVRYHVPMHADTNKAFRASYTISHEFFWALKNGLSEA